MPTEFAWNSSQGLVSQIDLPRVCLCDYLDESFTKAFLVGHACVANGIIVDLRATVTKSM